MTRRILFSGASGSWVFPQNYSFYKIYHSSAGTIRDQKYTWRKSEKKTLR